MKNLVFCLFLFPFICWGQIDSLYGTYKQLSMLSHMAYITLKPNGTFIYKSPIDVGYVPDTKGIFEIKEDTLFFSYPFEIHPTANLIEKSWNPHSNNIKIKISGIGASDHVSLNITNAKNDVVKCLYFDSTNTLLIDSLSENDILYLHVNYYYPISIVLDFKNHNQFYYLINLPILRGYCYFTEEKGIYKDGIITFPDNIIYYNTALFKKKKDYKKLRLMRQSLYEK